MNAFIPNDIVKSKLGTKFLIIKPKSFEPTTNSLDIIYLAFNMNLKQEATLRVSSKHPDNFMLLSRDDLLDEEKTFNIEAAKIYLNLSTLKENANA